MIRLTLKPVPAWPKLAWLARFEPGSDCVDVYHGPMVETAKDWCAEAVWAGDFACGDFDRTTLVFGTGIRCRGDHVVFVSAGTGVDRLWYVRRGDAWCVSNSLPALLAAAGLALREDYPHYSADIQSVEHLDIKRYKRSLPAVPTNVNLVYFNNLVFDGCDLREAEKPDHTPPFPTFDAYHRFLIDTAKRLGANLGAPDRRHRVIPLVGISSGYDSGAAAVIARHAGCTQATTIRQARSLWRGSDSGVVIARHLNLDCQAYDRIPKAYPYEETIWAAVGVAGGLNLTRFDFPEPLCLFFSGSYGDKVWDRLYHDLSVPKGDRDHLLGEFRLLKGVFQCVVPWWGIHRAQEINAIGAMDEMRPWALQTRYDRPIARRLLEEAGVPRKAFGIRKKDTSSNLAFLWPYSPDAQARFARYLKDRGLTAPVPLAVRLIRCLAQVENLLYYNFLKRLGIRTRWRPWLRLAGVNLLFQWGNEELMQRYKAGLEASAEDLAGANVQTAPSVQDNRQEQER